MVKIYGVYQLFNSLPPLFIQLQQSPKSPHLLSPEDGVSAAVESYNPRGSASFIEQRQAAKECKY